MATTTSLDFDNTELAFQSKSDPELLRTYRLMRLIDNPILTVVGPKMIQWAFTMGMPIKSLVKKSIFDQFVGGESIQDSIRTSTQLGKYGVKTILDYAVEGEKNELAFDLTSEEILNTLKHGADRSDIGFSACKVTGLGDFELLAKLQSDTEPEEEQMQAFERVKKRLNLLVEGAKASQTPLLVDAEESWIQDTIDKMVEEEMRKYNQEQPVVFHTIQMYRHDRLSYLKRLIEDSEEKGYILAIKLVRGAYMEKESDRAAELGYTNPIQPSKAATDADFNLALKLALDHIHHVALFAATHNEESVRLLAQLMGEKGIRPDHPRIWFSQLLGMSDNLSFNLASHGYNVAKYVPYGPVKAVLPYLFRRAQENTSVAGQASREVELLSDELKRRKAQKRR